MLIHADANMVADMEPIWLLMRMQIRHVCCFATLVLLGGSIDLGISVAIGVASQAKLIFPRSSLRGLLGGGPLIAWEEQPHCGFVA